MAMASSALCHFKNQILPKHVNIANGIMIDYLVSENNKIKN